jgi:hypothetical protein
MDFFVLLEGVGGKRKIFQCGCCKVFTVKSETVITGFTGYIPLRRILWLLWPGH